jgi:hypothetical protein
MEKAKALGLFRMRVTGVLSVFKMHGLDIYIPQSIEQIEKLAIQLHKDLEEKP